MFTSKNKTITKLNLMKKKKRRYQSRHHLIPKERVKLHTVPADEKELDFNRVLLLWRDRHDLWHYLFHNLTLGEIISLLQRIERIKYKKDPNY